MRVVWTTAGFTSFGLGAVGTVVPLLPTVPFMILAAFCFARGSDRFHDWLVEHPRFGAAIQDWRSHGAISRRGKMLAVVGIAVTFSISLILEVPSHVLWIQAGVLSCVTLFILTRPHGPAG